MKKFFLIFAVIILLFCACEEKPQKDWQPQSSSPEAEILRNEEFYSAKINSPYGMTKSAFVWNEDDSITFQSGAKLVTLSCENEILEEVVLSGLAKTDFDPLLIWNEKYILAAYQSENSLFDGAVYPTEEGEIKIINAALFDRSGNFIREYPKVRLIESMDEYPTAETQGSPECVLLSYSSDKIIKWNQSGAFIAAPYWVGHYDFEKDCGSTFWHGIKPKGEWEASSSLGLSAVFEDGLWFEVLNYGIPYHSGEFNYPQNDGSEDWNVSIGVTDITVDFTQEIYYAVPESCEKISDGNIIAFGESSAVFEKGSSLFWMEFGKEPVQIVDWLPESNKISIVGDWLNFQNRPDLDKGETYTFYCYNIKSGKLFSFETDLSIPLAIKETREENGVLKLYYIVSENNFPRAWVYDTETGYSTRLSDEANFYGDEFYFHTNKSKEYFVESEFEHNEFYRIRISKFE